MTLTHGILNLTVRQLGLYINCKVWLWNINWCIGHTGLEHLVVKGCMMWVMYFGSLFWATSSTLTSGSQHCQPFQLRYKDIASRIPDLPWLLIDKKINNLTNKHEHRIACTFSTCKQLVCHSVCRWISQMLSIVAELRWIWELTQHTECIYTQIDYPSWLKHEILNETFP